MTTRRGFLAGMLALGAAPAIVRAGSLMPVRARALIVTNTGWSGLLGTDHWLEAERYQLMNDPALLFVWGEWVKGDGGHACPILVRCRDNSTMAAFTWVREASRIG